jgi:fatty-acyl-CoA synthase
MRGLMQQVPLTVEFVLRRAMRHAPGRAVVTGTSGESVRLSWTEVAERAARLRAALRALGVAPGDRVATFARNSHRHVELLFAVPWLGAVLNPVNVRLFPAQVAWILRHAGARVLFVDASLTATLGPLLAELDALEVVVVMDDGGEAAPELRDARDYESLLGPGRPDTSACAADEDDALALCYTSGTTGNPKGVLFSHRSTVLHALGLLMVDSHGVSREDSVLPVTGLYHVLGWGLPYATALAGADLVLPGPSNQPEHLARLIQEERVTKAAAVPTVWVQMARLFHDPAWDLSSVRELLVGGAPVPRDLIRRYRRHGVAIAQGWGMTEMSPSGTMSRESGEGEGPSKQGAAIPLVELRLSDFEGNELPWDGESVGELETRGPCIASAYYQPDDPEAAQRFRDGWLRTGDLARVEPDGTVEIVDRTKDLVKSGGEWISSVELENAITAHPGVLEAAVIAVPDPKWDERPLALVVPEPGAELGEEALRESLRSRVAKWWIPDRFELVDEIPRTATGKHDKKQLRERYTGQPAQASTPSGTSPT